jgi:hypothetical protein
MIRRSTLLLVIVPVLAACGGGGSSSGGFPTIQAAKTYSLAGFTPSAPVRAGKPVRISFTIRQPNGKTLTAYKHGAGPHTGIHLIMVRRDLSTIVHLHPPVAKDGSVSTTVTFTQPGPYRVVIDAYPRTTGAQQNFQLFTTLRVAGTYRPQKLPPYSAVDLVDGYRVAIAGKPNLHAIEDDFLHVTMTAPDGKPATLSPWFGAIAHAIFFRLGSLDYFHTHVCAPGANACAAAVGSTRIHGTALTPGKLTVGVLVPAPGTWRLFLQFRANGHIVTAPFTLDVKS